MRDRRKLDRAATWEAFSKVAPVGRADLRVRELAYLPRGHYPSCQDPRNLWGGGMFKLTLNFAECSQQCVFGFGAFELRGILGEVAFYLPSLLAPIPFVIGEMRRHFWNCVQGVPRDLVTVAPASGFWSRERLVDRGQSGHTHLKFAMIATGKTGPVLVPCFVHRVVIKATLSNFGVNGWPHEGFLQKDERASSDCQSPKVGMHRLSASIYGPEEPPCVEKEQVRSSARTGTRNLGRRVRVARRLYGSSVSHNSHTNGHRHPALRMPMVRSPNVTVVNPDGKVSCEMIGAFGLVFQPERPVCPLFQRHQPFLLLLSGLLDTWQGNGIVSGNFPQSREYLESG